MALDHMIITVSLGVLKVGMGLEKEVGLELPLGLGVVFTPALLDFKWGAMGGLGFGMVNKLIMEMDDGSKQFFPFLQMAFD